MEQIDLTNPQPAPVATDYTIDRITFDWTGQNISIRLVSNNSEIISHHYTGTIAKNLMIALNKTDLSVKSLHRRVMEKLIADGVIVGTISGTPD